MGFKGDTFEDLIKAADEKIAKYSREVLAAHEVRNAIVYSPDYKIDLDEAKKILSVYENAINGIFVN
jgi:hypothetical protein